MVKSTWKWYEMMIWFCNSVSKCVIAIWITDESSENKKVIQDWWWISYSWNVPRFIFADQFGLHLISAVMNCHLYVLFEDAHIIWPSVPRSIQEWVDSKQGAKTTKRWSLSSIPALLGRSPAEGAASVNFGRYRLVIRPFKSLIWWSPLWHLSARTPQCSRQANDGWHRRTVSSVSSMSKKGSGFAQFIQFR